MLHTFAGPVEQSKYVYWIKVLKCNKRVGGNDNGIAKQQTINADPNVYEANGVRCICSRALDYISDNVGTVRVACVDTKHTLATHWWRVKSTDCAFNVNVFYLFMNAPYSLQRQRGTKFRIYAGDVCASVIAM